MKDMLIKVIYFDCVVAFILCFAILFISIQYVLPTILGLLVALIGFIISGIVTERMLNKQLSKFLGLTISFIKVLAVVFMGLALFRINKYYLIAYMGGFVSNFAGIIAYAVSIKDK